MARGEAPKRINMAQAFNIYHDLIIQAPISEVYAAVSSPAHLVNWWPARCSGVPTAGEAYNFYFTPEYDWYGQVIQADPPRTFHIRMTQSDADWDPTSFGFDLTPGTGGVQVSFWHVGWPACNAHYKRSSYCWAILLQGLKNYVEKGEVIPFAERE